LSELLNALPIHPHRPDAVPQPKRRLPQALQLPAVRPDVQGQGADPRQPAGGSGLEDVRRRPREAAPGGLVDPAGVPEAGAGGGRRGRGRRGGVPRGQGAVPAARGAGA
jgi:hypothetical protein